MSSKIRHNIHLTHDNTFFDRFVVKSEAYSSSNNRYIVYKGNANQEIKHVKHSKVEIYVWGSKELNLILYEFERHNNLYIHFLSSKIAEFILKIPKRINIVMVFWGGEVFHLPEFYSDFYREKNLEHLVNSKKLKFNFAWKPWNLIKEISVYRKQKNRPNLIRSALKRFNYFAHYIHLDFELIQSKGLMLDAQYVNFHYGSIYEFVDEWKSFNKVIRNNILVGNSASLTNNHINLFHMISELKANRKLICPLSYSAESSYLNEVVKLGYHLFGTKFSPLFKYLPRSEYCEMIYSCSHVIMGHVRSEGCGNIFRAIAYGSKVFLDDKNLFYTFLKVRGFVIYSHKHLSASELNTDLSRSEIDLNRNLLMKYFNEDQLKLEYNNLLSL